MKTFASCFAIAAALLACTAGEPSWRLRDRKDPK
jgi:hypothetical protein